MRARIENWIVENPATVLVTILGVAAAAVVVVAGSYAFVFRAVGLPPSDFDKWGQLGDFFGGTLNPIFGFLSVLALLVALVLQSKELAMSREELRLSREEQVKATEALAMQGSAIQLQSFEQTFFAMLRLFEEVVGGCSANPFSAPSGQEMRGREAIEYYQKWVRRDLSAKASEAPAGYVDKIREGAQLLRRGRDGSHVTRYARTLSTVLTHLRYTGTAPHSIYPKILRGQLSSGELLLIYFLSFDDEWAELKGLVEEFGLLAYLEHAKTGAGADYASFFNKGAFQP